MTVRNGPASPDAGLEVLEPGPQLLVEDLGRAGLAHAGVATAGAWDRPAHRLAQRLLGNPESAAGLESVLGGFRIRALQTVWLVACGAEATLDVDGLAVAPGGPFAVLPGQVLTAGPVHAGVRLYLGVRGGIATAPVLGSRSWDTMSGLGPEPLRAGSRIPVGPPPGPFPAVDHAAVRRSGRAAGAAAARGPVALRVLLGPREDWFEPTAVERLLGHPFTVVEAGRAGLRLSGPALPRRRHGELPPDPMVRGAIQVLPSGDPVVLGADHPTTGGYPVLATVLDADTDVCAQLRPGDQVRFAAQPGPELAQDARCLLSFLAGR